MDASIDVDRSPHFEKFTELTRIYLELGLPFSDALRAAAADLQRPEEFRQLKPVTANDRLDCAPD